MALITWGPKLEVGIKIIDKQHRGLIDLINELHQAMTEDRTMEVMTKIFGELVKYTHDHFGYEEGLMKQHGYEEYEEHRQEHMVFTDQMDMYRDGFEGGSMKVTANVLEFLRNWLLTHITGTDRGYVSLFKKAGVE